jgi:phosphatidylglycerophosphate synthase
MNQPLMSQQNEPRNPEGHQRINDAFLRPLEKPALNWLAAHMPYWVTPDHLTALGMFASVLIAVSLVLTNISPAYLWLASLGVALNWFGDSLDGTLARYRKIERSNYGYFIDHAVDALDEVLIFLALGISPYVRMELAGLALVSYLLLSIQSFLYSQVSGVFQISFIRIGPTEMRVVMILSNTVVFFIGNPMVTTALGIFTMYDFVLIFISLLLFGAFIVMTILHARELAAYDTRLLEQKVVRDRIRAERAARRAEIKAAKIERRAHRLKDRQRYPGIVNVKLNNPTSNK